MNQTKHQQAQQYAEKKIESEYGISREDFIEAGCRFGYNDVVQAYSDGYTAYEQSMWRSVEEELPSYNDNVLVYIPSTEFRIRGYDVAYWDGEDWYTHSGDHIRPTFWMEVPKLNPE